MAFQANVGKQTIIQLAQLALSMGARQVGFDLAHQARRGGHTIVEIGFAAHLDRRHFSSPNSQSALALSNFVHCTC